MSNEEIERKISLKQKTFMRHEAVRVRMFDEMYQFLSKELKPITKLATEDCIYYSNADLELARERRIRQSPLSARKVS